jgi:ubiquinone biosynthesis protein
MKNAARLKTIVATFARNGFQNVAEKLRLGRFVLERFSHVDISSLSPAQRMSKSFEELGPTFVKLGQVLATRPDLIPEEFVAEFKRLHDQVAPISFDIIELVLKQQFGSDLEKVFLSVDPQPLAAASIAQVHRAVLVDGSHVVVKVQRPGISEIIQNDTNILYYIADLLSRYVPEARAFNPYAIVDEFFKTLELELNFIVEANNIRRFQANFANDPMVKIPKVYLNLSGKKVLVLEALEGLPLSQKVSLEQVGVNRESVMKTGMRCYFQQVFKHGVFHGDLHAGNLFILPDNRIGLVDFGIVGHLTRRVQDAIANMFLALYNEDYERLAFEYVDVAPFNDSVDVDHFAKDLQDLLAPYFGLALQHVDLGRLLLDSASVAARHRLILPAELLLFFKSIVAVEGMGRAISPEFDLLGNAMEFAQELVSERFEAKRVRSDLASMGRDGMTTLRALPRQLKQVLRRLNHPEFAFRISLVELDDIKRSIETSSNLLFLGLVIGSLNIAGAMILARGDSGPVFGMPVTAAVFLAAAFVLALLAFYNYIKKD